MSDEIRGTLAQIAGHKPEIFGAKEENVKQHVMIPILECFGHKNRLNFEYGTRREIDIFVKDLPSDCKVIAETKKYGANLDDHLDQLKGYVDDVDPLLAILTNGEEIRIYSRIRGYSFERSCLYIMKRAELNEEKNFSILENLLNRENLLSRKAREFVAARENEIVTAYQERERIEEESKRSQDKLKNEIDELTKQIEDKRTKINLLQKETKEKVTQISKRIGLELKDVRIDPEFLPPLPEPTEVEKVEVTLEQLLNEGLIKDGQKIHRRYKDTLYEAVIITPGKVKTLHDNRIWTSLSEPANRITGTKINGWTWWKIRDENGKEYLIDDLRKKYLQIHGKRSS